MIPGLFDSHAHYTRAGVNPGYEARRIERASSIADLQDAIARRAASVPPGEFITCIGGWNHTQLAEARRPTKGGTRRGSAQTCRLHFRDRAEEPVPSRTVSAGPSSPGKGVAVDDQTGVVMSAAAAVAALQATQTPEQWFRRTADLNAHASSLGLTAVVIPGRHASPLPLLDDVGDGFLDQGANLGLSVSPRQSPRSSIRPSMSSEGDAPSVEVLLLVIRVSISFRLLSASGADGIVTVADSRARRSCLTP